MNKTDFLNLTATKQLTEIEECGEVLINFFQGAKNITLYKINSLLIKVVDSNGQFNIEVINEADIPNLFHSRS